MLANEILTDRGVEDLTGLLANVAPFQDLPDAVLSAVANVSDIRTYAAGETLYALGQYDGSEALIVARGQIKASHSDPASGAMMFEDLREGDTFGIPAAVAESNQGAFALITIGAEKESTVIAIEAEALRSIVSQRPSLTKNLMLHFARQLAGGASKSAASEFSPDRRVYAALVHHIERDAIEGLWRITKMPKHRELADQAGVDESVAAAAVAKLIQSGVARRDYPGLVVDDITQLNRLAS